VIQARRTRLTGLVAVAAMVAAGLTLGTPLSAIAAAPSNDNFANAIVLSGSAGAVSGSTANATTDSCHIYPFGYPRRSVWYRWTAPFTGWARFRTDGSSFDAQVSVQPAIGACPESGSDTEIRTEVQQGISYLIGVGSQQDAIGGPFVLSWTLRRPPPPPNDDLANALEIFGRNGQTVGSNAHASKEPGEPAHAGEPGGRSIWFKWRAPKSGRAMFHTMGSENEANTVLAVYTGSRPDSLTKIASDANSGLLNRSSRLTFQATAGIVYRIALDTVGGRETTLGTCRETASCGMHLAWNSGPGPPNDGFADAKPVSGDGGQFWWQNVGARQQDGEPSHAQVPNWPYAVRGRASVWFSWTAPNTGRALFEAGSPDFVPLIAIYHGSTLSTLQTVAENEFRWISGGGWTNRSADWQATEGETYYIAVDAEFEQVGQFSFSWLSRPVNDDFTDATVLPGIAGRIVDANSEAGRQDAAGEPNHEEVDGDASVWYRWTAPASGTAVIDTLGTESQSHRMAVYTGSSVGSLTPVAATEIVSAEYHRVTFSATAGTVYRIAVDSPLFGSGFHLNWRLGPSESVDPAVSLTGPPDGARVPGMVTWGAQATDASGIARVVFLVDGTQACLDTTAPYSCTWSTNVFGADVPAEFGARAIDNYGNEAEAPTRTILGDSGAPELSWESYPTDPSTSASATFAVSGNEVPNPTWECSLGDAPFRPCTFPISYSGLGAGGHYWRGRSTDALDNTNSSPATFLWEIVGPDTIRPSGSVTINGGATRTDSTDVRLKLLAWDVDSSIDRVRISNSSATNASGLLGKAKIIGYSSPVAWRLTNPDYGGTSGDGTKRVYVQFRDSAGNWSSIKSDSIILAR
jgi:hypothetical protein